MTDHSLRTRLTKRCRSMPDSGTSAPMRVAKAGRAACGRLPFGGVIVGGRRTSDRTEGLKEDAPTTYQLA